MFLKQRGKHDPIYGKQTHMHTHLNKTPWSISFLGPHACLALTGRLGVYQTSRFNT